MHKTLIKYGLPLQYSLFFVDLAQDEFNQVWQKLEDLIDAQADDLRAYPITVLDYEQWQKINSSGVHNKMIIIG